MSAPRYSFSDDTKFQSESFPKIKLSAGGTRRLALPIRFGLMRLFVIIGMVLTTAMIIASIAHALTSLVNV